MLRIWDSELQRVMTDNGGECGSRQVLRQQLSVHIFTNKQEAERELGMVQAFPSTREEEAGRRQVDL